MANTYSLHHLRDMLNSLDELISITQELKYDATVREWLKDMNWLHGDVQRALRHSELIALQDSRLRHLADIRQEEENCG